MERRSFSENYSSFDRLFKEKISAEITAQEKERYGLLAVGNFSESDMTVTESEKSQLSPQELEAKLFVDEYVRNLVEEKNKVLVSQNKRLIVDSAKLHVSHVEQVHNTCEITIENGIASYGKIIALGKEEGLRQVYAEYCQRVQEGAILFERFQKLFQPAPLSVDGLILTSDNCVLIAKRHPNKVGTYGEAWHVPSGYVDDTDCDASGKINLFQAMRREIHEEIGITENEITNLVSLGVAKNPDVATVNVLFFGSTQLKSTDIIDRDATDVKKRLLLQPKDIEGDIRPRKIIDAQHKITHVLPALLKIDQVFGKQKKHGVLGPELTVPTSQALFFLVDNILKQK
jgi:8-oxo-dGTP pyrophosphatase MutT (NUDIX family)